MVYSEYITAVVNVIIFSIILMEPHQLVLKTDSGSAQVHRLRQFLDVIMLMWYNPVSGNPPLSRYASGSTQVCVMFSHLFSGSPSVLK